MVIAAVQSECRLTGTIYLDGTLVGVLSNTNGNLVGSLTAPRGYEDYIGSYEVTPSTAEQIMNTADKHLTDNIIIHEIPYYNVSNQSGGSTVYIGNGVE